MSDELKLKREELEPILENTASLNDLETPVILSFLRIDPKTIKAKEAVIGTCMGDNYKIVNMLMDYARILETAIEQWELEGFHKAAYEIHAKQCRKIANRYAAGIGYDYEAAVLKCQKLKERGSKRDDGVGEEALALTLRNHS